MGVGSVGRGRVGGDPFARSPGGRPGDGGSSAAAGRDVAKLRLAAIPGPISGTEYQRTLYAALPGTDVRDVRVGSFPVLGADVTHWHWPEVIAGFAGRGRAIAGGAWMRACRVASPTSRWVWTVHNLDPHTDAPRWEQWVGDAWLDRLAGVVFLNDESAGIARARWPAIADLPTLVTRHQRFDDAGVASRPRREVRRLLGLPTGPRLVGIAGKLRTDKGVTDLLAAWDAARTHDTVLVIWGELDAATRGAVATLSADADVIVHDARPSDLEMRQVLRALDACVLPYRAGTNSGLAVLALSVGTPVLALPGVWSRALRADAGPSAVVLLDDVAAMLDLAGDPDRLGLLSGRLPAAYDPETVAEEHCRFFTGLVRPP